MSASRCSTRRSFTAAGPASDLYSMAVTAFLMVTGRLPFTGPDIPTMLYQHVNEAPVSLKSIDPMVPSDLDAAILRSLSKRATCRHKDAAAFAADLRAIQSRITFVPTRWCSYPARRADCAR